MYIVYVHISHVHVCICTHYTCTMDQWYMYVCMCSEWKIEPRVGDRDRKRVATVSVFVVFKLVHI